MTRDAQRFTFSIRCTNCGTAHPASRNACPGCGAAVYVRIVCGYCGYSIAQRADPEIRCPGCGAWGKAVSCARCGVSYPEFCATCPDCRSLNESAFVACTECERRFPIFAVSCPRCGASKPESVHKIPTIPPIVTCENCGQLFYNVTVEEFTKASTESHPVFQGRDVGFVAAHPTIGNRCPTCGASTSRQKKYYTAESASETSLEPADVSPAGVSRQHPFASARTGLVYVLFNPHMPGLVKIGKTSRDANLRAAELSQHTGVPADFIVVFQQEVTDCDMVERLVHERLSERRLPNREFFKVSVEEALHVVIEVSQAFRLS